MSAPGEPAGNVLDPSQIAAARVAALARAPYLATPLFAAPVVVAPGSGGVTVDRRWQLHCDPEAVATLSPPALGALFVHLVSHVLRDHARRFETLGVVASSDPAERASWNNATDAEINDDLAPAGLLPPLADLQPDDFGAPSGRAAEDYCDQAREVGRRWDCGSGCDATDDPVPSPSGVGLSERDAEWVRLATAAECRHAEQLLPGSVPAGWLRWAEQVLPSKVDWRRVLAAEIRAGVAHALGMVDYRYSRPSRRAEAVPEVILPVLERPIPEVAIVCDTSGSMGEDELARSLAEVEGILRRVGLRHGTVPVLACDTAVHALRRVRRSAEVELAGGGGTDMGAGIAAAAALRPRPDVVVVLTDGMTPWPDEAPRAVRVLAGIIRPPTPGGNLVPAPPSWVRVVDVEL